MRKLESGKSVICVDFDGTCVTHVFPEVGKDIGAQRVLERIVAAGHELVLFTMRDGEFLDDAVKWFYENKIPLYGINENPTQKEWTQSPKAYCQMYIDDLALGAPIIYEYNDVQCPRGFIDWNEVERILEEKGLI